MIRLLPPGGLLRPRGSGIRAGVSNVELFFDLVFAYAVTQLSHGLLDDLSPIGVLHTAILFLAVWWVWIYTTWVTNWLDPERTPVRLALFVLMLAGIILSISIPQAFGRLGLAFAGAYVFIQVGRTLFMLWALGRASAANTRNFQRILVWLSLTSLLWIAGGLIDSDARLFLWLGALAIDNIGPSAGFWVPGLGRSTTAEWDVDGAHLAERCSQFILIALGESLLVTGGTFAEIAWTVPNMAAFAAAFVSTVALWWIYFDTGATRASHYIEKSADPGRVARLAFTYLHLLVVAGIIVTAVSDELFLAEPLGPLTSRAAVAILTGPALYLLGNILFKRAFSRRLPLSHLVGLALIAALAFVATFLTPLALYGGATAALVIVAIWETLSLRGRLA